MKKFFFVVCLLASVSAMFAQKQHGYVKTRGRLRANGTAVPGTRLSGATITFYYCPVNTTIPIPTHCNRVVGILLCT